MSKYLRWLLNWHDILRSKVREMPLDEKNTFSIPLRGCVYIRLLYCANSCRASVIENTYEPLQSPSMCAMFASGSTHIFHTLTQLSVDYLIYSYMTLGEELGWLSQIQITSTRQSKDLNNIKFVNICARRFITIMSSTKIIINIIESIAILIIQILMYKIYPFHHWKYSKLSNCISKFRDLLLRIFNFGIYQNK